MSAEYAHVTVTDALDWGSTVVLISLQSLAFAVGLLAIAGLVVEWRREARSKARFIAESKRRWHGKPRRNRFGLEMHNPPARAEWDR